MNELTKHLITPFVNEENLQNSVGVFGGGFQPPTKGHLQVVKQALEQYPLLDKFIIFVGTGGGRSNITQEQSIKIWNIYKKLLPNKVEIVPSSNPISSIYFYTKENPQTKIKWFLGSREGREEDFQDFTKRTKSSNKPNLEVINIVTKNGVSGTAARKSLGDKELFFTFLPSELSIEDKEEIYNILQGTVNEWIPGSEIEDIEDYADEKLAPIDVKIPKHFIDRVNDKRNSPEIETDELYDFFDKLSDEKDELEDMLDQEDEIVATDSDTDINIPLAKDYKKSDTVVAKTIMRKKNFATSNSKLVFEENVLNDNKKFTQLLGSLTLSMIENGLNIDPLPNIEFINDDIENANDFLGKTAYYDPNTQTICLYTYSRHPKDILRSYAHEMIHHIQNLEDRINNIQGDNINEDEYLAELELEAYSKGNMLFRGWENSLNGNINEWVIDIPKYDYPKTLAENLWHTLNEITLNPSNAVEIYGDLTNGKFQVGDNIYVYDIKQVSNPYNDGGRFFNIMFHPEDNKTDVPTGTSTKEDYIKILSTMYKIILDFAEEAEPEYIGISSMDNTSHKNYHRVYNNLTDNRYNRIPEYFRKDANLKFSTPQGKGRFIVLKRKND